MQAAGDFGVRSPLAECGLTKADVRALARHWGIEAWDKPATPCLSSRIAYGVGVTPERLARIDAAEQVLRSLGLGDRPRAAARERAGPARSAAGRAAAAVRRRPCAASSSPGCASWASAT